MNRRAVELLLRAIAIVIALAAVIDPTVTSMRATRPDVAVIETAPGDSALARDVVRELTRRFNVVRGEFPNASATVLVGNRVPSISVSAIGAGPVFAVLPSGGVRITRVDAPARAPFDARVPIEVAIDARDAANLVVDLLAGGVVVDRVSQPIHAGTAGLTAALSFVPTSVGTKALRVRVLRGDIETSHADMVVQIERKQWHVLVFDPRPSWMSTFVRRALERDTRFVITSRTVTSTNVSTDAGRPPASLSDATALNAYDAIVVGAPETVTEQDAEGLRRFLRERGGGVALLFDERKAGAYERLASLGAFESATNANATRIAAADGDTTAMRASEWMWPATLPVAATVVASSGNHAIVFQTPVGGGRLLVSGALDGWKFRDPTQSGFERFWQTTIGELADASAPALELQMPVAPVVPGTLVSITLTLRRAALAPHESGRSISMRASAELRYRGGEGVRLWPSGAPGVFRGTVRAPDSAGVYAVVATADHDSAAGSVVVADDATEAVPGDSALLAAWTTASGGAAFSFRTLDRLEEAIVAAVHAPLRRSAWHPMRSPWWLFPFVLALSGEWWLRRRRARP